MTYLRIIPCLGLLVGLAAALPAVAENDCSAFIYYANNKMHGDHGAYPDTITNYTMYMELKSLGQTLDDRSIDMPDDLPEYEGAVLHAFTHGPYQSCTLYKANTDITFYGIPSDICSASCTVNSGSTNPGGQCD